MEKPVNFTFDAPCMSLIVIIIYIERNRPLGTQAVTRPFFLLMREVDFHLLDQSPSSPL